LSTLSTYHRARSFCGIKFSWITKNFYNRENKFPWFAYYKTLPLLRYITTLSSVVALHFLVIVSCSFVFSFYSVVRGYHIHKDFWLANFGEVLPCIRETANSHDPFAVSVLHGRRIVGHNLESTQHFVPYSSNEVVKKPAR